MRNKGIEIKIDRLINSIINVFTGDIFDTEIEEVSKKDIKLLKSNWNFDWIKEYHLTEVYKLTIKNNPNIIQGLIGLIEIYDNIRVNLVENASFNIGKNKIYEGVAGNLFAFACKVSFERGHEGNISFISKSNLISHYEETIGAKRIGNTQ
ncbi:MAG: hypothetical protein ABI840_09835 [bacterium]